MWKLYGLGLLLSLAHFISANTNDQVGADIDYGTFESPSARVRPRFRYWLPDASVDPTTVKENIQSAGAVGAGGVEFLPFYNYGGEMDGTPPGADWSTYGFGTEAFKEMFLTALKAHKDAGLVMDFPLGPNQGQGVPAEFDDQGLQWDLSFSTAVPTNGTFEGILPGWGTGELVAFVSAEVLSSKNFTAFGNPMLGPSSTPYTQMTVRHDSLKDWSKSVSPDGHVSLKLSPSRTMLFAFYQCLSHHKSLDIESDVSGSIFDNGSYVVDHFSAKGARTVTKFWERHMLVGEMKYLLAHVGNYAWEDSVEILSNISWTPSLPDIFEAKYGYNLRDYLPLVMFGNNNINAQNASPGSIQCILDTPDQGIGYLNDFRGALIGGYRQYLETITEWVNSHLNLQTSHQVSYNLPMDMAANVPMVNAPECESLQFQNNIDGYRQFVGPADLTGKRVISNEMGAGFQEAYRYLISELLWSVNRAVAAGVNQFVLHGQSYTGDYYGTTWPGYTAFSYMFSELYSNKQPAWDHGFSDAMNYIARTQYLQQRGVHRTDVAIYNKVSATDPSFPTLYKSKDLARKGYTYSYLSPDNFGLPQAHVQNGTLAPGGPAYRALVINSTSQISVDAVEHIQEYARSGLPIIFNGGDPRCYLSGNGSDQHTIEAVISELKQTENVYSVTAGQVAAKLQSLDIRPRIEVRTNGTWYPSWREDAFNQAIYAFVISDGNSSTGELSIATTMTPYFLDPWTGQRRPVFEYKQDLGRTVVPLNLAGNQTVVIEFNDHADASSFHATQVPATVLGYEYHDKAATLQVSAAPAARPLILSNGKRYPNLTAASAPTFHLSNWTLTAEHWDAPQNMSNAAAIASKHKTTHHLHSLVSWTSIPGLVNASGVGYYTTNITWPPHRGSADGAYLVFPKIAHAMQLHINGQRLPPFDYSAPKVDIGPYLQPGSNEILAVVPTTMWNYIRSILDKVKNIGSRPLLVSEGEVPGLSDNGLAGTVTVVPYVRVRISP